MNFISGLRNLMQILKNCVERKMKSIDEDNQTDEEIIYQTFIDSISSKLKSTDLELFTNTIKNLFIAENVFPFKKSHESLDEHFFMEFIHSENLQLSKHFHQKVIETYERIFNQSGIAIVGHPFTGKSTILKFLIYIFQHDSELNDTTEHIQIGILTTYDETTTIIDKNFIHFRICQSKINRFTAFVRQI